MYFIHFEAPFLILPAFQTLPFSKTALPPLFFYARKQIICAHVAKKRCVWCLQDTQDVIPL